MVKRGAPPNNLLLMHMDKLVLMLDNHISAIEKWKSLVGLKIREKLMSYIIRSCPIVVMLCLGEE